MTYARIGASRLKLQLLDTGDRLLLLEEERTGVSSLLV